MSRKSQPPSPAADASIHASIADLGPMPDAKPIFFRFLSRALELGIVDPLALTRKIPPTRVFESMDADAANRARIVHACTGMEERFTMPLPFGSQGMLVDEAIKVAAEEVAKKFVDAVGIPYYIEHIPLLDIFEVVMGNGWMVESSKNPNNRQFAADINRILVEEAAWNGSKIRTYEQILKAISLEHLFGDTVPNLLKIRMIKKIQAVGHMSIQGNRLYLGEMLFDAAPFDELSEVLTPAIMGEPFALYAQTLGLIDKTGPKASLPPPPPVEEEGQTNRPPPAAATTAPAPAADDEPVLKVETDSATDVNDDDIEDALKGLEPADQPHGATPSPLPKDKKKGMGK